MKQILKCTDIIKNINTTHVNTYMAFSAFRACFIKHIVMVITLNILHEHGIMLS